MSASKIIGLSEVDENVDAMRVVTPSPPPEDCDMLDSNCWSNGFTNGILEERNKPVLESKSLASALNIGNSEMGFVSDRPKVVGHRGSVYHELENTLKGFQVSSEIGCDAVEMDVFLLKCSTLIVFHGGGADENPGCLRDYCGIDGNILDYTAEEARKLPFNPSHDEFPCPEHKIAGEHAFIPTLHEVLQDAKKSGLTLKLELKGPGTPDPVLELVEEMGMVDQCRFSSFSMDRIARIRELRPDRHPDGTYKYKTGALFKSNLPENFIEVAQRVGASEVHLKYDTCTVERVKAIHDSGMDSMAWFRGPAGIKEDVAEKYHDVGNEDELMYLTVMSTGVRALCVNKPDVLLNILGNLLRSTQVF